MELLTLAAGLAAAITAGLSYRLQRKQRPVGGWRMSYQHRLGHEVIQTEPDGTVRPVEKYGMCDVEIRMQGNAERHNVVVELDGAWHAGDTPESGQPAPIDPHRRPIPVMTAASKPIAFEVSFKQGSPAWLIVKWTQLTPARQMAWRYNLEAQDGLGQRWEWRRRLQWRKPWLVLTGSWVDHTRKERPAVPASVRAGEKPTAQLPESSDAV